MLVEVVPFWKGCSLIDVRLFGRQLLFSASSSEVNIRLLNWVEVCACRDGVPHDDLKPELISHEGNQREYWWKGWTVFVTKGPFEEFITD